MAITMKACAVVRTTVQHGCSPFSPVKKCCLCCLILHSADPTLLMQW